jgi:3',5'-nucleoside bisphosphate phosphatase
VSITADLHTHSTTSDGALSPGELLCAAAASGVEVLALTDHDRGNSPDLVPLAAAQGVLLVMGMELMCRDDRGEKVDIVGLGLPWGDPRLDAWTQRILGARAQWTGAIQSLVEREWGGGEGLAALLIQLAADPEPARRRTFLHPGDLYGLAIDLGIIPNGSTFLALHQQWLAPGRPLHLPMPDQATAAQAVELAHDVGGVAVLALSDLPPEAWEGMVRALVERGLDGVEVHHPALDDAARGRADDLRRRYGLLLSGGSDFHDARRGALAAAGLDRRQAAPLLERLGVA